MKTILSLLACVGVAAAVHTDANAAINFRVTHGSTCQAVTDLFNYSLSQFGFNSRTGAATDIICPIPADTATNLVAANMTAYDRNCSLDVSATLFTTFTDGTALFTQSNHTSGCGGPAQDFGWTVPAGMDGDAAFIAVHLPPLGTVSGGMSHVASYFTRHDS